MPAVRDLDRGRGAPAGAFGYAPARSRQITCAPGWAASQSASGPASLPGQHVDRQPGGGVNQDGPVDMPAAQREIIDADHLGRGADGRVAQGHDQAQQRVRWMVMPSALASRAPAARPARARPGPVTGPAARCGAGSGRSARPLARRTSPPRRPGSCTRTGAFPAGSAPAGHLPGCRATAAHSRYAPARTRRRTAGTPPGPTATVPRSQPVSALDLLHHAPRRCGRSSEISTAPAPVPPMAGGTVRLAH